MEAMAMADQRLTRRGFVCESGLVAAGLALSTGALKKAKAGSPTKEANHPKAAGPPKVRLLSRIDTEDFGAETVRIGDLDGDGGPDLLFVQSHFGSRAITCLTATTIHGQVLWQSGKPSADNGTIYSDLPVQVYDWDNDGRNEVLYVRQAKYLDPYDGKRVRERASRYEGDATMVVLDAATGREKTTFSLPAPADDCFLFADLTGRGRPEDLVVKDRYWNLWGVAHDGKVLWHWKGSTGHFPAVADVDNDGRDEVFVGFALIDHDGKVLFSKDPKGEHQDACWIARPADGRWRLLFGNGGIHCLAVDGAELWHHPLGEAQHVVAGRFRKDSELQFAVVDRTPVPTHRRDANAWAILFLYDLNGKEIWRRQQQKGDWAIAPLAVNWSGPEAPQAILVYGQAPGRPAVLCDGGGEVIAELPMEYVPGRSADDRRTNFYALVADVWGDCRDEVILFGSRGACMYTNPRPLAIRSQYNETLYPGM
jgi:hypothetical protein